MFRPNKNYSSRNTVTLNIKMSLNLTGGVAGLVYGELYFVQTCHHGGFTLGADTCLPVARMIFFGRGWEGEVFPQTVKCKGLCTISQLFSKACTTHRTF
jgi:hypothetical protein